MSRSACGQSRRTSLRPYLSWPESYLVPATQSRWFAGARSAQSLAVVSDLSAGLHSWLSSTSHRRCIWLRLVVISATVEFDSFRNCYVIVSGYGWRVKEKKKKKLSYLQTWPLWVWMDMGNGGASVRPSDTPCSLVEEGAGLMGCDAGPSVVDGLPSCCLSLRGLGDLPCWLSSSGGGEQAMRLG